MATFTKFNSFIEAVFEKQHNFASDSIKFYLTNAAPVATNTVKANIAEIAAGNGYTAGGYVMTVTASSQTGGPLPTFRYAVAYNDTATNHELVGYWDYGSAITPADGDSFPFVLAGNLITAS